MAGFDKTGNIFFEDNLLGCFVDNSRKVKQIFNESFFC